MSNFFGPGFAESRLPLRAAFRIFHLMSERPVSTLNKPDASLELTLRPSFFADFTGQAKVKKRLEITTVGATQRRGIFTD